MMAKGFTYLEMIVAVAILLTLGTVSGFFMSNFLARNSLQNNSERIVGSLRLAASNAVNSKGNQAWGVCLIENNTIRIFSGTCDEPIRNEEYKLAGNVSISAFSPIIFSRLRGETGGNYQIIISQGNDQKTISINPAGVINVN